MFSDHMPHCAAPVKPASFLRRAADSAVMLEELSYGFAFRQNPWANLQGSCKVPTTHCKFLICMRNPRRATLKIKFRKKCGFDSPARHHCNRNLPRTRIGVNFGRKTAAASSANLSNTTPRVALNRHRGAVLSILALALSRIRAGRRINRPTCASVRKTGKASESDHLPAARRHPVPSPPLVRPIGGASPRGI
jgi:hypothetical protein